MKPHEHKYIAGTIGDECEFCGLLKSTIESLEGNKSEDVFWEKKFNEILITKSLTNGYRELCGEEVSIETIMKIKLFIKSLLDAELSKLETKNNELWDDGYSFGIYKINGIIKSQMEKCEYCKAIVDIECKHYDHFGNQALFQVLKLLKKEEKNKTSPSRENRVKIYE